MGHCTGDTPGAVSGAAITFSAGREHRPLGADHDNAPVYFALKEKVDNAAEIHKAFPGYDVLFGVFSKSGFTQRMLDTAKGNNRLLLIDEDHLA